MNILRHVSKKLNEQAAQVSDSEIAELCHEFSVTQQKLEAEIEAHGATITREAQLSLKLKVAEARIRESQEQKPYCTKSMIIDSHLRSSIDYMSPLYEAPVIHLDVAKLQRENGELKESLRLMTKTNAHTLMEAVQQTKISELTRKLTDSDTLRRQYFSQMCEVIEKNDKLLAEAKSKAVPEGWQLVPKEPTLEMVEAEQWVIPEPERVWEEMLSAAELTRRT